MVKTPLQGAQVRSLVRKRRSHLPGVGTVVAAQRLFSCVLWASVVVAVRLSCPRACGILVPSPRTIPLSPALQGRFLTREVQKQCIVFQNLIFHFKMPPSPCQIFNSLQPQMQTFRHSCWCCQLQTGTCQEHCQWVNYKGICHVVVVETEPCATAAVDLQQPLGEFRVQWGSVCSRASGGTDL